jgi:uncharacterized protein YutE (UPF0331/DUF86 family)
MNLDRDVLIAKLGQLQDAIARVESRRPATLEQLLGDRDTQDIIAKNLERAVGVSVDIATHLATMNGMAPRAAGESFRSLADRGLLDRGLADAMARAVGFRNISVHDYVKIDWGIVMHVADEGLSDLRAFARWAGEILSNAGSPPAGRP